jgi:hypothetical protein
LKRRCWLGVPRLGDAVQALTAGVDARLHLMLALT